MFVSRGHVRQPGGDMFVSRGQVWQPGGDMFVSRGQVWQPGGDMFLSRGCLVMSGTYPGEDGEEAEKDGGSGGVGSFVQRVVLLFRNLPLIGQKTETNEPDQRPECCRELS